MARICVVEHVADKRFDMLVCEAIEHVPTVAPTLDEVLTQENSQAL